ncbi:MAG: DNA recombination/repair protein RecA, partial [Planctomycetes bacterium]|nr:DNA recombination/repair protein RecA [Planctomycetota bacterium]
PGGRALKFYSSIRLDIRRITTLKEGDLAIGNRVKAKVVKNKVAAPFQSAEFDIMFNSGISTEGDLIDLGIAEGLIEKTGSWVSYGQVRLGQGRENAKQFIQENPDLAKEIREKILAKRRPAVTPASGNGKATPEVAKATAVPKEDPAARDKAKAKPKFPPPKGRR